MSSHVEEQREHYQDERRSKRVRGQTEFDIYNIRNETFEIIQADISDKDILAIGCGDDDFYDSYRQMVGVDVNPNLLEQTSYPGVVGDGSTLPFANNSFEAVLFYASLHHMPDVEASLDEAKRVLKDGGTLLLLEPLKGSLVSRWMYSRAKNPDEYVLTNLIGKIIPHEYFKVSEHEERFERSEIVARVSGRFSIVEEKYIKYLANDLGNMFAVLPSVLHPVLNKLLILYEQVEKKLHNPRWATIVYIKAEK
jgi:ubiquinone/menaquinone biosynthesis C-methylase UbiE